MSTAAIILLTVLLGSMLIGLPIAWAMLLSSFCAIMVDGIPIAILAQRLFTSMDSFAMLAVPLFLVAGDIMAKGSISKRLVAFAESFFGSLRGGLAVVAIVACTIFAALTGSALATTAAIGAIMFPAMKKNMYPKAYSTAVLAIGGTLGPVIPPSTVFIFYAQTSGLSVVKLFMSGVGPGILSCVCLSFVAVGMAIKDRLPKDEGGFSLRRAGKSFISALPALLMPVIILGGIYSGVFTATESAAVAVMYGVIVSVLIFRDVKPKDMVELYMGTAKTTANLMLLIASANVFGYLVAYFNITTLISNFFTTHAANPAIFMLISGVLFLITGMFMEAVATVVILVPILHPLALSFGIDPIQYGCFMVFLLCLGIATPPFAPTLYLSSSMNETPVGSAIKKLMPFIFVQVIVGVTIAVFPALSTWLPNILK